MRKNLTRIAQWLLSLLRRQPRPRPTPTPVPTPTPAPGPGSYAGYTYAGSSAHVDVYVSASLGAKGLRLGKILAAGLLELYYKQIATIFFGKCVFIPIKTTFLITGVGTGAYHYRASGTEIYSTCTEDFDPHAAAFLYCCEVTEVFGATSGCGWESEWSHGEALSRTVAGCLAPKYLEPYSTVPDYVKGGYYLEPAQADWISKSKLSEVDGPSIAAGVCFLYYLHSQLGLPWDKIVATLGGNLEAKFEKLTGRKGGYAEMIRVLAKKYPKVGAPALVGDNPFPIH